MCVVRARSRLCVLQSITGSDPDSLRNWHQSLATLLANRTAGDSKLLVTLADKIMSEVHSACGAHMVYLLAGCTLEPPRGDSRLVVLGEDLRKHKDVYLSNIACLQVRCGHCPSGRYPHGAVMRMPCVSAPSARKSLSTGSAKATLRARWRRFSRSS